MYPDDEDNAVNPDSTKEGGASRSASVLRAANKIDGAVARIEDPNTNRGLVADGIYEKAEKLAGFIDGSPGLRVLATVRLDRNDRLLRPEGVSPSGQAIALTEYATTEAAVASLYTSSSDVQPLPPESYRVDLKGLNREIDENGIVLSAAGTRQEGVKTRFYRIPSQQLDADKNPVPLYQQKLLVVQDTPLPNGAAAREFSVTTADILDEYLEGYIDVLKPTQDQESKSVGAQTANESDQPQQVTQIDEQTEARYLSSMSKLAESVAAGRTQPRALQTYVEYSVRGGVSRYKIDEVLQSHGIPITRLKRASDDSQEPVESLNTVREVTKGDLNPLVALFHVIKERSLREGNMEALIRVDRLPVGILMNSAWTGVSQETLAAFRQTENELNAVKQQLSDSGQPEATKASQSVELPLQELDDRHFRDNEVRIRANKLASDDLSGLFGERYQSSRINSIRQAEKFSTEGRANNSELTLDVSGYIERHFTQSYQSPNGEIISEGLVMFSRQGSNGQIEWLNNQGNPVAISADLYSNKLPNSTHNQDGIFTIPRINDKGAYTGVITIVS